MQSDKSTYVCTNKLFENLGMNKKKNSFWGFKRDG